jgi:tetratricopeptide (TPR) repeat protein
MTATMFINVLLLLAVTHVVFASGSVVAIVVAERGHVTVERSGQSTFQPLDTQQSLCLGDTVQTAEGGQVAILFADGSQIKLNENSSVRIPSSSVSSKSVNLFQALAGVIWAHLRPGQTIQTPSANIVVRGTEVAMDVSGDGATQLTVVAGDVDFANTQGTVELTTGEQSTARPGEAPTAPIKVDSTGLISWTADVVALPLVFETPGTTTNLSAADLQARLADLTQKAATSPGDSSVWTALGDARRESGDAVGAINAYNSALRADPTSIEASIGKAMTELSQGRIDDARAALQPVSAGAEPLAIMGLIDIESGNAQTARQEFVNALALNPDLYSADSLLALCDLQQYDLPDADLAAHKATSIAPRSAEAEGVLSTVLFFEGKTAQAKSAMKSAIADDPESPLALIPEGRLLSADGHYVDAASAYEKALVFGANLAIAHQELGDVYLQLDNPEKATEEYRIALNIDPSSAVSHAGRGRSLQMIGEYRAASDEFKSAVGLSPQDTSVRYYYASFLVDRGDLSGALEQINAVKDKAGDFGLLYARLAEIYLYRQDLSSAQKYALEAVSLLPDSATAHYELGRVYLEQQETFSAQEQFRIATVLDRRMATARYALGLTQEKTDTDILTGLSNTFNSSFVGSPASSTSLNNLETPGANERIQAAVEDPTSVRAASRSYGDTELDAQTATHGGYDLAVSYLADTDGGRGVIGGGAETQFTPGIRKDSDNGQDTANFVVGQKAQNSGNDYVVLGDFDLTDQGNDSNLASSPYAANERYRSQLSRITTGFRLNTSSGGDVLAILQGSVVPQGDSSNVSPSSPFYSIAHWEDDSLDGEVRWDVDPASSNSFTFGASYGDRRRLNTNTVTLPAPFGSLVTQIHDGINPLQAYIRDDMSTGRKWSFVGQLQLEQEVFDGQETAFGSTTFIRTGTTTVLPYLVAQYKFDRRTVVRVRYQRTMYELQDFDLLTPTDDFLITYADLPQPAIDDYTLSADTSTEIELDRTESRGAFASVGVFRQDLGSSGNLVNLGSLGSLNSARVQGVQASYQGELSSQFSYFLFGAFNSVEGVPGLVFPPTTVSSRGALIPDFDGVGTLQYLNRLGEYSQLAYYYQGDRPSGTPGSDFGAFGVLDLRVGKRFGLSSNIFAEVNNVLDKQYDIVGLPQPGTEVRVGLSQRY